MWDQTQQRTWPALIYSTHSESTSVHLSSNDSQQTINIIIFSPLAEPAGRSYYYTQPNTQLTVCLLKQWIALAVNFLRNAGLFEASHVWSLIEHQKWKKFDPPHSFDIVQPIFLHKLESKKYIQEITLTGRGNLQIPRIWSKHRIHGKSSGKLTVLPYLITIFSALMCSLKFGCGLRRR